jgi:8-oxo-dGTP pyrophosphatase MutT (NUDIX family)
MMKTHSCGAILYTIYNNKVFVILGKEHGDWFPFKGTCEPGETYNQTAAREIEEETCKLVRLSPNDISLDCEYHTPRKIYHIGLNFVPYTFIREFYIVRRLIDDRHCLEKTNIRMFDISKLNTYSFHQVTTTPLQHYYPFLDELQRKINHAMSTISIFSRQQISIVNEQKKQKKSNTM